MLRDSEALRIYAELYSKDPKTFKPYYRDAVKSYNLRHIDPLDDGGHTHGGKMRRHYSDDLGESFADYGIFDVEGMSEEEIDDFLKGLVHPRCGCAHDCCGHVFTVVVHHKMLPNNRMSVVHYQGLNY